MFCTHILNVMKYIGINTYSGNILIVLKIMLVSCVIRQFGFIVYSLIQINNVIHQSGLILQFVNPD